MLGDNRRMELLTRADALATGRKRYFTGKPCPAGHIAEKTVKNGCILCEIDRLVRHKKANPRAHAAVSKRYRERRTPEQIAAEKHYRLLRADSLRESRRAWKVRNPYKVRESDVRRNLVEKRATPSWADFAGIAEIYRARLAAQELFDIDVHVDHIVPLRSKRVSGLHVGVNLRLMPGVENSRKGNHHWPDMWEKSCDAKRN